ncbi:MAG: hypothetical protein ACKO96_00480, partial [Flammeovirgaceae bacterium]
MGNDPIKNIDKDGGIAVPKLDLSFLNHPVMQYRIRTGDWTTTFDPQNPLHNSSNGEAIWSLKEFVDANRGLTRHQLVNQRESQGLGQPGGPTMRYVINPADNNVVDMRHMLIVGPLSPLVGTTVEAGQWVADQLGLGNGSGWPPQAF